MKSKSQVNRQAELTIKMIYNFNNSMLAMKPGSHEWNEMTEQVNKMQAQLSILLWVLEEPIEP